MVLSTWLGQRKKNLNLLFFGAVVFICTYHKIKFGAIRYNFKNDDLRTGYCTKLF